VAFAEAGTWEPVEDLTRFVTTDGGRHDRQTSMLVPHHTTREALCEACSEALRDALMADPRVFLMGEDVGKYGGCYAVSARGCSTSSARSASATRRCPSSAFVGAGIGAALGGMRPIVEVMTVNFSLLALDQIVNNAATLRHMSGGQFNVPLVIRMATGAGRQLAAQHSHSLEGWYAHIPGIRVLAPATVEDARGMLWTACSGGSRPGAHLREQYSSTTWKAMLATDAGPVDIDDGARAPRPGSRPHPDHLQRQPVQVPWRRPSTLAREGIEAEVIDLRSCGRWTTRPILASVRERTGRGDRRRGVAQRQPVRPKSSARIMEQGVLRPGCCRWNGCAAPRCPSPTPATWRRPPCRSVDGIMAPVHGGWWTMGEFRMPSLGADMETGKLVEWLVVHRDTRVQTGRHRRPGRDPERDCSRWRSSRTG
jgi:2-oxoisovalerate dehydrogenase E1 component